MLDVLFIIPNSSKKIYQGLSNNYSAVEPPTWALMLSSTLMSKNYSCEILDCDALRIDEEEALKEIELRKSRLICFVLYGQQPNQGTFLMIGATSLAKKIKENSPDKKIGFIGSHISALPKQVLKYNFVDFVFINEGVYPLLNLLETNLVDHLQKVNGIGYKDNDGNLILNPPNILVPQDKINTDLPGYAWNLLPKKNKTLDLYKAHYWHTYFTENNRTPFAAVYSSLGCKFGCNFCMINILNRTSNNDDAVSSDFKIMRHWDPDFFVDQLEILANFGVETIRLSDEMFFLNKKIYPQILKKIIERGLKFNMWAYARVDTVREDQLELFKKAGVNWLALGIEASNQNIRQSIDKGRFRDINIRDVVKLIQSYDINVLGNYIFGFPEEKISDMQETLDLAIELNTEHANFYPCQALPGSPLYLKAKKENWDLPNSYEEFAFFSYESKPLRTKYCTSAEVLEFRDYAWQKYFTNPNYLNFITNKFGKKNSDNILELSKIKLKRKILGH
tara:strand:+ start:288 stop:1805 length:1518 start_codon:yes stop_codon:yes gene_type:complete